MKATVNIFWFRRDLRLSDNAGLYHALRSGKPVIPIFIFDTNILDQLEDKTDRRVNFIHEAVSDLQQQLIALGSSLEVYHGPPIDIFEKLSSKYDITTVFTNHDYEPYARKRDEEIGKFLENKGISFKTYKDQVIFEKSEVVKDNKEPYTVFTPYSRKWKATLTDFYLSSYPTVKYFNNFHKQQPDRIPSLESMGFKARAYEFPPKELTQRSIKHYNKTRDFPGDEHSTSRLGVHLRFGTISVRELIRTAQASNQTYLNELVWREFYQMILWHFPKTGEGHSFRPEYDHIRWINSEEQFQRWCDGTTGYPLVDAGMRELNTTGYMHNRVRMVTASFLSKHLLIDWRWGEAYFAAKLLDYEMASNVGGWQWAAGCGCDAAPYFRVFNPTLQAKKFDPQGKYINKWVPEYIELTYLQPIVEHDFARKRAIEVYSKAVKSIK